MFSSIECAVSWAARVLLVRACTYVPRTSEGDVTADDAEFCVVERVGGPLAYPHDEPEIAFQVWARREARAEQLACMLAVAARTMPISDAHVNGMGVPSVCSYGREEGGWFVWQTTVPLKVNLLD
ncbi:hypothetical protein HLV35_03100 [Eggerthellaceae bacterium zg-997]|nr:hypothetical protein [Eggerthellaceae bacterium zg-997]